MSEKTIKHLSGGLSEVQKERVRTLVAGLRSGKYKQAAAALRVDTGAMCCLGVACELSGLGHWSERTDEHGNHLYVISDLAADGKSDFPWADQFLIMPPVQEYYGFREDNPLLIDRNDKAIPAAALNDERGAGFPEIADAFERTYLPDDYAKRLQPIQAEATNAQ